jgi:mono/diheme cytochrome c family protein
MFHILTYGQKNMPSYASQVSEDDRWKAILYVRSLQRVAQTSQTLVVQPVPAPSGPNGREEKK